MLGLLHDFGKVVACTAFESALLESRSNGAWQLDAWAKIIERVHVPIGRHMAAQWHLPQLLIDVISSHHDNEPRLSREGLLAIVKASDEVVALLESSPGLTADDLASIAALSEGERKRVAHVVEQIPGLIAAFESTTQDPSPSRSPDSSAIARPNTTLAREDTRRIS
jgi:HD-like signal output (HDOD) protein